MKASDLFVQCLMAEGVEYVFGMPGEENIDVIDSLARSPIQFILTRHEQAAAFMADVYARVTGKPGVCLSTLGPGATNLTTGVASAQLEHSQVVAITGQVATTQLNKHSHQNVNTIRLFEPITQYNQSILYPLAIPEVIRKAFASATSSTRRGSAHVQLPSDVAKKQVTSAPLPIPASEPAYAPDTLLERVAHLVERARHPIILAGHGVIRHQAWSAVRSLVESTHIPLVTTYMAKGILPFHHPYNLFTMNTNDFPDNDPLQHADLIIAIGVDMVEVDTTHWLPVAVRQILHIHTMPAEIDVHYPVTVDVVGDIEHSVRTLADYVTPRAVPDNLAIIRVQELERLYQLYSPKEALPQEIISTLNEVLPESSYVVSDVGLHKVWMIRWFQPKAPGRTIIFNGLASMGGSLPGALACCLARPDDPVVVVTGDAGFLMNAQELETAHRLGLHPIIVVFNDRKLGLIEHHEQEAHLAITGTQFTNPNFELYAKSFSARYYRIQSAEPFAKVLQESLDSRRMVLIEVVLD